MFEKINIYALLCLVFGLFFFIRNIRYLFNSQALRHYVATSPKAYLWQKKFGIEKTIKLTKNIFLPIGILISLGLIILGAMFVIV